MKKYVGLIFLSLTLTSCATDPDKMTSSYVSPLQYQDYSCKQIAAEAAQIERRVNELYGSLKKEAKNDSIQMGVGLVLFWPTLFFLEGGDDARAYEYQRLKGEYEALQKISVRKQCGYEFKETVVTPPEPSIQSQGTRNTGASSKKPSDFSSLN